MILHALERDLPIAQMSIIKPPKRASEQRLVIVVMIITVNPLLA
jgi:hypothetical protein